MAASIVKTLLGAAAKKHVYLRAPNINQTWTRTAFFRWKKDKESAEVTAVASEETEVTAVAPKPLRKREGLQTVRGYKPPADVESRIHSIASTVYGTSDWMSHKFTTDVDKFEFLTRLMEEFDHFIPNMDLTNIHGVSDAVAFFSKPVRDTTVYEDLASLDLPPNLHIQLEPLRFDPETDTMFGGVSAFPGRPTIVSSLKYKRKYGKKE